MDEATSWDPIRLRASSIAACVGVHPYAQVDELFTSLIYQGSKGAACLAADAAAVGAVVETREEAAARTLSKASEATQATVRRLTAQTGTTTTTGHVNRIIVDATKALDKAVAKRELSEAQARDLRGHVAGLARTEFGRRLEGCALRKYEAQTGSRVRTDGKLHVWNLGPASADARVLMDSDTHRVLGTSDPLFCIVGIVDAFAEEVDCRDADPERWSCRDVVVEVKNRVSRTKVPPDLHDEIQLLIYMLMTECPEGDLVQTVRSHPDDPVVVTRVTRERHAKDWANIILPRLYALVATVDALRRDEPRRRAWLKASPRDRWNLAAQLCDWLPTPPYDYVGAFVNDNPPSLHQNDASADVATSSAGEDPAPLVSDTGLTDLPPDDADFDVQLAIAASLRTPQVSPGA